MPRTKRPFRIAARLQGLLWGPQMLAFLPALSLGAFWIIGEGGLILFALGLPVLWAIFGGFEPREERRSSAGDMSVKTSVDIAALFAKAAPNERALLMRISIENRDELIQQMNGADLQLVQDRLEARYKGSLRAGDIVTRSSILTWTIAVEPGANLDLEAAIQQASRLQSVVGEPFFLGDDRLYLSSCIGFTLAQMPMASLDTLMEQAALALEEALLNSPDAIRAYSPNLKSKKSQATPLMLTELQGDIESCLTAWFQPQISTDTGQVCGFEALARWRASDGHLIAPAAFIPVLEKAGQMERLTELILSQSLAALAAWDKVGLHIESVGVNFSESDLANPRLYDMIAWDLDRYNIAPHRLCIEVLESVIAGGSDDIVVRNVMQLAKLGCQIDLDDFGTGHASISTLRHLPVRRLKIDRSFVAKADLDSEQQKMVGTILMMADRLGLSCLAEGVETLGEHTILAQLGCSYVQGFGIAKPMPFEDTIEWIKDYQARLDAPPQIGGKTGLAG